MKLRASSRSTRENLPGNGCLITCDYAVACGSVLDPQDSEPGYCDRPYDEHFVGGIALIGLGLAWEAAALARWHVAKRRERESEPLSSR